MPDALAWIRKEWRQNDFAWGTHCECFLGVCSYAERITGRDPGTKWRGKYNDEQSAHSLQEDYSILHELTVGFSEIGIEPWTAIIERGCIVICDFGGRDICGIFDGVYFMFKTPDGLRQSKAANVVRIWKCD